MKNYYHILGIDRNSSNLTIKKVYRKLALEFHPDLNKSLNAHEKFIELNEAYQVLNNSIQRKQYNQIYDYRILNKFPKRKKRYTRRYKNWESSVKSAAEKGKKRGKKYASESGQKFKKRKRKWNFTFVFELIFNFFGELIAEIIFMI